MQGLVRVTSRKCVTVLEALYMHREDTIMLCKDARVDIFILNVYCVRYSLQLKRNLSFGLAKGSSNLLKQRRAQLLASEQEVLAKRPPAQGAFISIYHCLPQTIETVQIVFYSIIKQRAGTNTILIHRHLLSKDIFYAHSCPCQNPDRHRSSYPRLTLVLPVYISAR